MHHVSLNELLAATGGKAIGFDRREFGFADIGIDSRSIRPGALFWALRGERLDGHDFVADALARGAAACVVGADKVNTTAGPRIVVPNTLQALWDFARWYRRQQAIPVVAVTGSVGKTTTREMIHAVLSNRLSGTRSPKNFNNHFGVPLSVLGIEKHHEFAVLELGASAAGEIRDLAGIAAPEIGVVTAIAAAHLDGFGSEENIIAAKGELIETLTPTGLAVLAGDDPRVRLLADRAPCQVILVGEKVDNDLQATHVAAGENQLAFRLDGNTYKVHATGRHHLVGALIAIAVGREMGMEADEIDAGLQSFTAVPGRCQLQQIGPWTVIDDTYNANPRSMQAACELLRDWQGATRKVLVTGDMLELGARMAECHRELGRAAATTGIDFLLAHGEQSGHVTRGALDAGMDKDNLAHSQDIDELLAALDDRLEPGDVVLVKGSRAMRMERVVCWLRERAENNLKGDTSRVPTPARVCV